MKCSICGEEIECIRNWCEGNNAQPINDGRCCNKCNANVVIPARLKRFVNKRILAQEMDK